MKHSRTISKTVDRLNSDTYLKSSIREETAAVKKWAHSTFQVHPGLWPPPHKPSLLLDLLVPLLEGGVASQIVLHCAYQ